MNQLPNPQYDTISLLVNDDDVVPIVQCNMLALLNQTWFTDEKPEEDDLGQLIFKSSNNGLTLAAKGVKDIKELGTGLTVHRLINALLVEFTQRRRQTITIPLIEIMQLFGLANTKHAQKDFAKLLRKDLALINKLWLSFEVSKKSSQSAKIKKKKNSNRKLITQSSDQKLWVKSFSNQKLCDSYKLKNGIITFELTPFFYQYLESCNFMALPKSIFKLRRYRNAPYLGYKLSHYRNCIISKKNKAKNTPAKFRLSVEKLLSSSPFLKSLTIENLNGQGWQRIKEPFETAMEALTHIDWHYCQELGITLNDKKLQNLNYQEFLRLYVEYKIVGIR